MPHGHRLRIAWIPLGKMGPRTNGIEIYPDKRISLNLQKHHELDYEVYYEDRNKDSIFAVSKSWTPEDSGAEGYRPQHPREGIGGYMHHRCASC